MYLSDLAKILSLAAVLSRLSESESRTCLVALAWTLRNREKSRKHAPISPQPGGNLRYYYETMCRGEKHMTLRPWSFLAFLKFRLNEGYCKSLAITSLVWCGEEVDPTAGSTHFHRHDDWPEWAKNSEPVALIGSWFFYNKVDVNS